MHLSGSSTHFRVLRKIIKFLSFDFLIYETEVKVFTSSPRSHGFNVQLMARQFGYLNPKQAVYYSSCLQIYLL